MLRAPEGGRQPLLFHQQIENGSVRQVERMAAARNGLQCRFELQKNIPYAHSTTRPFYFD